MSSKTETTDSSEGDCDGFTHLTPPRATRVASCGSESKQRSSELVALTASFNHKLAQQDRRLSGKLQQVSGGNLLMVMVVFVGLLVGLGVMGWWSLEQLGAQQAEIQELKGQVQGLVAELRHMERVGINLEAELGSVRQLADRLRNEILDLHMNELIKEERSIHILKKYSSPFRFMVEGGLEKSAHYKADPYDNNLIRKTDEEISMLVSEKPVPAEGIHYLELRVQSTLYGMISVGLMSQ